MKNEEIHKGFSQGEVRDFLSQELRDARAKGGIASVEYVEAEIEKFQELLKHSKKREAILQIIGDKNWEEWDLSDEIPYNSDTYFSFIGTEEECNELVKKLKEENTE